MEDRAPADEQLPFVKFNLGSTHMTSGFRNLFQSEGAATIIGAALLDLHSTGDFGALDESDRLENLAALHSNPPKRLLSRYLIGVKQTPVYVITEHDRSSTMVLLVSEY